MLYSVYAPFSTSKLSDDVGVCYARSLQQLHDFGFVLLNKCDYSLAIILGNVFGFIFPSLEGLLLVLLPHHRTIVILALCLIVAMLSVGLLVVRLRRHHRLGWRLQLF